MDYVVGSVAALISGNVTPNRPRLVRRAFTPTKHQPSPNVTPKSEFIEDRSIFLSPTLQKKKAIVKKSPKRIFENPELETTNSNDGDTSLTSPKTENVKKHLKNELDSNNPLDKTKKSPKHKLDNPQDSISAQDESKLDCTQNPNENSLKKKKKKRNSLLNVTENIIIEDINIEETSVPASNSKNPKKMKERRKSVIETENSDKNSNDKLTIIDIISASPKKQKETGNNLNIEEKTKEKQNDQSSKKKNRKRKKKGKSQKDTHPTIDSQELTKEDTEENSPSPKTKNKKLKKSEQESKPKNMQVDDEHMTEDEESGNNMITETGSLNPNAITDKDSDSEHDSDDEIESENEEINKKVLDIDPNKYSSDEEEEESPAKPEKKVEVERETEADVKRTLFVGNVPFSKKCKKEIKKIFSKHGQIQTVRIRTVPIKDGRFTPKLAVIKNELHPERTTVNVYIKYADAASVEQALVENNTVLNEHHLRVTRSEHSGAEHSPQCAVFVGNLPFALEDDALRDKFRGCGDIDSVRIVRDKKTNAGKGFGYVNFASKDGVELALALSEDDLTIKNRILRVKRCVPPSKQKPEQNRFNRQNKPDGPGPNRFNRQQRPDGTVQNQFDRPRPDGMGQNRFNKPQRTDGAGQNRFNRQGRSDGPGQNRFNRQGWSDGAGQNRFNRQGRPDGAGQNRFNNQHRGGGNFQQRQMNQSRGFGQGRPQNEDGGDGAFRRIMKKREHQGDGGDGPPNKKQNTNPPKEKKSHKEFVGMTAEKKKKRKFDKGQKKKKALSEILTK